MTMPKTMSGTHSRAHPVDLQALADIVFGNCHKWMLNAKGSAFLYVRRELQNLIDPLIVSWGYNPAQKQPQILVLSIFAMDRN